MQLLFEGITAFDSKAEMDVSRFISLQTQEILLMMRARHSPFVTLRVPPSSRRKVARRYGAGHGTSWAPSPTNYTL